MDKLTAAEQARAEVEAWYTDHTQGDAYMTKGAADRLIARLTPVFERAQDAEGSREFAWKAIERVVAYEDVIVALREWAERAEAVKADAMNLMKRAVENQEAALRRMEAAEADVARLREVVACARTVVARWKDNAEPWPPSAAHLSDALDALAATEPKR